MISLLRSNKLKKIIIVFTLLVFNSSYAATPEDIWKKTENQSEERKETLDKKKITIESPIVSDETNEISIKIDEKKIGTMGESVIGIFDPEENNFTLDMWSRTDGKDIKNILKRINKLKLSKSSEDLLFEVLFTNAYPPKANLTSQEFLKIKIDWLIKNQRFKDLEVLLKNNPEVGKESEAIKFLVNEYLSSADIKSACEKMEYIAKDVQNDYLDKFSIYCLVNNDHKVEAQMLLDLSKERGLKDKFFENKINYLLEVTDTTTQKILDNSLLNFYLSHMTVDSFDYKPDDKTDKYIWRYLSSANLIQVNDIENAEVILTYEQAAQENSFRKDEVFKIYLRLDFNFNQLVNVKEIYKTLPNYKARALVYQSILLSDNVERKLNLIFLLKDLFIKDKLLNVYSKEMSDMLKSIDPDNIPDSYANLVKQNMEQNLTKNRKIKFDNSILHRSKVIKHFLENSEKSKKTEKDFKAVYKKIKKNKKYFYSIKDIIVLESLAADGYIIPNDLDYGKLSSELTVPKPLMDLVDQKQTGLVVLKIIEIIGEDDINDLDPETIYFLNKILNQLDLKKIRNNILSEALPAKV
tara:strand:+ start:1057 stop:2799 length:1743 start_codon:yes stop_codon:yes gene_type:complete